MMSHHTRLIQSGVSSSILLSMGTYPCLLCRTVLVFLFLVITLSPFNFALLMFTTPSQCNWLINGMESLFTLLILSTGCVLWCISFFVYFNNQAHLQAENKKSKESAIRAF
ncbi:hypothetical protein S83_070122 [Arachis hypogaea]|nr:uncharacterized protein DS421_20g692460 [Arachis hypogaea]